MRPDACANLRTAMRAALEAAEIDGVPSVVRMTIAVAELGRVVAASAAADSFDDLLAGVLAAVEHAARAAHDDCIAPAELWLN